MDAIPSAIVAIVDSGHNTVLMLLRSSDAHSFAAHWCFPGGRVEPGETSTDTAVREAFEETGLTVRGLRHRGTRPTVGADLHHYEVDCSITSDWTGRLRRFPTAEHDEARWVPTSVAATLTPMGPVTQWLAAQVAGERGGFEPRTGVSGAVRPWTSGRRADQSRA